MNDFSRGSSCWYSLRYLVVHSGSILCVVQLWDCIGSSSITRNLGQNGAAYPYLFHYFRIPDPIPHPYTDAFHMSSTRNAFLYYLYVLSTYPSSNYMYFLSISLRILRFSECLTPWTSIWNSILGNKLIPQALHIAGQKSEISAKDFGF